MFMSFHTTFKFRLKTFKFNQSHHNCLQIHTINQMWALFSLLSFFSIITTNLSNVFRVTIMAAISDITVSSFRSVLLYSRLKVWWRFSYPPIGSIRRYPYRLMSCRKQLWAWKPTVQKTEVYCSLLLLTNSFYNSFICFPTLLTISTVQRVQTGG